MLPTPAAERTIFKFGILKEKIGTPFSGRRLLPKIL